MTPGGEPPRYQVTVTVDDADRYPLPGATVAIDAYTFPPTDENGQTVARIPRGVRTLTVSRPGYCGQLWQVDITAARTYGIGLAKEPCKPFVPGKIPLLM